MAGIPLALNFDLGAALPLDSRLVVANFTDLSNISQKYLGMQVYVTSTSKLYYLENVANNTWTEIAKASNIPTNTSYVDLSSAQTIGGTKTFSVSPTFSQGAAFTNRPTVGSTNVALTTDIPTNTSYVDLSSDQTIGGNKTFSNSPKININSINYDIGLKGEDGFDIIARGVDLGRKNAWIDRITLPANIATLTNNYPTVVTDIIVAIQNRAKYANTTLSAAINSSVTSISVASAALYSYGTYITIDSEILLITGVSPFTLNVLRGQLGTTAASHNNGASVFNFNNSTIHSTGLSFYVSSKVDGTSASSVSDTNLLDNSSTASIGIRPVVGNYSRASNGVGSGNPSGKSTFLSSNSLFLQSSTLPVYATTFLAQSITAVGTDIPVLNIDQFDGSNRPFYIKINNEIIYVSAVGTLASTRVVTNNIPGTVTTTTTTTAMDASVTTVTLTSASGFSTGQYIRIDSEIFLINSISTNTLTLTRAQFGTTAAAHSIGATVSLLTTTITVNNSSGFSAGMFVVIDNEYFYINSISGTTWTTVRSVYGTTIAAHSTSTTSNIFIYKFTSVRGQLGTTAAAVTVGPSTGSTIVSTFIGSDALNNSGPSNVNGVDHRLLADIYIRFLRLS